MISTIVYLLKKIRINPLFWFVIGVGMITGYFREIAMVFIIVFIHEMGHGFAAAYFKWKIRKIELLPFGGVAEVEEYGNRPLKEELIVIIAGPLQHIWLVAVSYALLPFDFWTSNDHQLFVMHNAMIAFFNLLPIWPLDGGKLLYLFFAKRMSFQKSLTLTLKTSLFLLSVFGLIMIILFPLHLNLIAVLLFLGFTHYFDWKQRNYMYMRFLLERHFQEEIFLLPQILLAVPVQLTVQEALKKFRRGVRHKITVDDSIVKRRYLSEKKLLQVFFDQRKAHAPIGSIVPK